jgi:signal transduction histidine kinase
MTLAGLDPAPHPVGIALGVAGLLLTITGLIAFNLGYIGLYIAFLPLLWGGIILFVEVGEDFFLSLLLFAVTGTLLYAVGLFALPLVVASFLTAAPIAVISRRWGKGTLPQVVSKDRHPGWRAAEFAGILLCALFARYVLYRSGGGGIPFRISEFESLARFVISEVGGWVVFALGYGLQHRTRYGVLFSPHSDFATSLPSLLSTGLFLVSPHVAIMTLGLNIFGVTGLYVGALPVCAAHILMRTLTLRRAEIERQNNRLQRMNLDLARGERMAAIGQMSSAISHQMLQKVGLLGLQCDLLRDALLDQTAPPAAIVSEAQARMEQLDAAITELNTTLSDLLVFSRDFALHVTQSSLDALLRELVEEIRETATARQIVIVYRSEQGEGVFPVDQVKLKQAILNLLVNALDASPSPGQVSLTLREDGEGVSIAITDQGKGILETDWGKLFSPFFSTKEKGTGLGLTFARKIVELHGGTLTAHNNPDGGATFLIELPVRVSEEQRV